MFKRGKRFRYLAAALPSVALLGIGSAPSWAEQAITLDLVRHGQSVANVEGVLSTAGPGPNLTALGEQQATAVADILKLSAPYSGLYASELIRTQETAARLATDLGMHVQILPGLNEIDAGIYEGATGDLVGLLYAFPPFLWTLGLLFVPLPGSTDPNGAVFDTSYGDAVQTIYDGSAADGYQPAVAFSSGEATAVWTMMNVNNPDPLLLFTAPLNNTGVVVVRGDPQDGWTLVSWNGQSVAPASLPTELFVNVRDLIMAPQLAAANIWTSLFTGDPVGDVVAATALDALAAW